MSFAARITRAPRPFDLDRGAEAAALFPDLVPELCPLIKGAAGCSPYLAGLLAKEAAWLPQALEAPEAAFEAELAILPERPLDTLGSDLRRVKRRVGLLTALADLGGVWPLETVTSLLTRFADAAVEAGLQRLISAEIARGKLPGAKEEDARTAGGMVVLAMGKMGAEELNYSSDIDLICLFDEERFEPADYHEARAVFIRATRKLAALLSETTAEGYVFRTDLRLRPDASVTPVCLSMEAAERYYESVGRTWERAAYIKARPCAGDIAAGERFIRTLAPFVWRKHLDFAAIQDAHDMRLRIRNHKGLGGALVLEGHDVKLGRGGIREIEFFTQTRQLIAGGRDPTLRARGTCEGLMALARAGWVGVEAAELLADRYRAHREVEHRLQMIQDAQTHVLPSSDEGFARLAAFMDREPEVLRRELRARFEEVHVVTESFFDPDPATPPQSDDFGEEVAARWLTYPALRSQRAVTIFERLKPEILSRLRQAARPDEALAQFDGFLSGLPAGVQLFSLFEANPQLTRLIVDIAATAPALARYLSRNAGVFDAVIGGDFFSPWPGIAGLREGLDEAIMREGDYEARLDAARRWAKEWHFRIGVHHLQGLIGAQEAGRQYADLAQAVVAGLWPVTCAQFAEKHGCPPGRGAALLAMGSLGAGRLNAASDLDLIVIYDPDGVEQSDGRRPLAARVYYARLTQALVTALSAPMAEGRLYQVDMRLRPSGRQGPVATSLAAFRTYQRDEAWTWEHLALTRARPVAGAPELGREVEAFRRELLAEKARESEKVLSDVAEMRARLAEAKTPQGELDAKTGPGRLQDIELLAQTAALLAGAPERGVAAQLEAGVASGWLPSEQAELLKEAEALFRALQVSSRLLTGAPLDLEKVGEGGLRLILRETGMENADALRAAMAETGARAAEIIVRHLPGSKGEARDGRPSLDTHVSP